MEKVRAHKMSINLSANYQSEDLYSWDSAFVLYADVNGFPTSLGALAVGYLCFRRHVWKAQQWLGYVSSASSSSDRLSSGGSVFRANTEPAFRNLTCLKPLGGSELRAVEETSLNHTQRTKTYTSVKISTIYTNVQCCYKELDYHKSLVLVYLL